MSSPESNGTPRASKVVVQAAGDVLEEVLSLAGLQVQLGMADFREARSRLVRSSLILAMGLVFILGAVPVLLGGIAAVLHEAAGWPWWLALLVSGGGTIVLAGLVCWVSAGALQRSMKVFERSQEQLSLNIDKIRGVLKRDRTPPTATQSTFREGETTAPH